MYAGIAPGAWSSGEGTAKRLIGKTEGCAAPGWERAQREKGEKLMLKKGREWYQKIMDSRFPAALFYIGLTLELLVVLVDKSSLQNPYESYLFRLTFLLFFGKMLLSRRSGREWAGVLALELITAVFYARTGANDALRIVTFVAACRGVSLKKAIKYSFWVTLAGCMTIIMLSVTGIYGAVSLTQAYGRGVSAYEVYEGANLVTQTRYTLGMGHPNALSCMFLMLTAMGVYAYFENLKWYAYLFLLFLNAGVFLLTDSKTSMLITGCFLLGCVVLKYCRPLREKKLVYLGSFLVFILCVGFSVDAAAHAQQVREAEWSAFYLGEQPENVHLKALVKLDGFLNGRIVSLTDTERSDGSMQTWSLWSEEENTKHYFDMGWVKLFYRYGVIQAVLYLLACTLLLWRFYQRKDAAGAAVFAALAVYTVMEAHLVSVYIGRNFLLIVIGCLLPAAELHTQTPDKPEGVQG